MPVISRWIGRYKLYQPRSLCMAHPSYRYVASRKYTPAERNSSPEPTNARYVEQITTNSKLNKANRKALKSMRTTLAEKVKNIAAPQPKEQERPPQLQQTLQLERAPTRRSLRRFFVPNSQSSYFSNILLHLRRLNSRVPLHFSQLNSRISLYLKPLKEQSVDRLRRACKSLWDRSRAENFFLWIHGQPRQHFGPSCRIPDLFVR